MSDTTIEIIRKITDEINRRGPDGYLPSDKSGKGYLCPVCGSGTGKDGTGITTKDGIHYRCWAGCFKSADLIDIIGLQYNLTSAWDKAHKAAELFNLGQLRDIKPQPRVKAEKVEPEQQDYTDYFLQANQRIGQTDYPQRRGLTAATIERFNLGYDPAWVSPTAIRNGYNPPPSPRFIIPTGRGNYLARDTRQEQTGKYAKMKEGAALLFNTEALHATSPIFIVEGEIDAMSIIEAGGEAIGLGSAANWDHLIKMLEDHKPAQPLILIPDNDDAGIKAIDSIAAELHKRAIPYYRPGNLCGPCKDANAALMDNRAAFTAAVQREQERAMNMNAIKEATSEGTPEAIAEITADEAAIPLPVYSGQLMSTIEKPRPYSAYDYLIKNFDKDLNTFKGFKKIKTGFSNLDKEIGAVYPGLYVIGAISSLGKTTFMHQIGDQFAKAGEHVLYFTLEQSALEMITKSLSRITAQQNRANMSQAKSAIAIRGGDLNTDEWATVWRAAAAYEGAERISIIPCNFDTSLEFIRESTEAYILANDGIKPIIIVDYLQIIPASDPRQSEREKTDHIVRGLKKLQADNNIIVFVVSSFNRSNYLTPVDYESFKESGGIEYTADVIWGLQLNIMNRELFNSDKDIKKKREAVKAAKKANPRKVELVCLKNRYGVSSYSCGFNYYAAYDLFEPDMQYTDQDEAESKPTRRI